MLGLVMHSKATLEQVAALSGFSTATVSRAFKQPNLLNPKTLKLINEAAEILGYNMLDKNARLVAERRIGVFVNLFQDLDSLEVLRGITNSLRSWNFELTLFESFDAQKELLVARKIMAKKSLDGVIFVGKLLNENTLSLLEGSDINVVLVDHRDSSFSHVYSPIEKAADLVFDYLHNSGCKELLFVGDRPESAQAKEALVLTQLHSRNKESGKIKISEVFLEPNRIPGPVDFTSNLRNVKPDAVFASSDFLALQIYRDCLKLGISVPAEIEIIGLGDVDVASTLNLSSVSTFLDAQGRRAAEYLYSQIVGHSLPKENHIETIAPDLIHRESTRGWKMKK
jgi:DNA-binding LacI/PurR family transcriptional regulator